jgi:hypothetical protein
VQKKVAQDSKESKATPEVVAQKLAQLMAPSLFNHDLPEQVTRCLYLMENFPLALLALLANLNESGTGSRVDRVKLAAALFHFCLKDASKRSSPETSSTKSVGTMLRVVGVLLSTSMGDRKKGRKGKDAFPAELTKFVYEHIREDSFIHLLEDDEVSNHLRDELLFALSPLDPEKLPKTVNLVRHELTMACRGGQAIVQLPSLLRATARWGLANEVCDVAWERLTAAATRLQQRLPLTSDTIGALTVAEAVFRDSEVRGAVLPAKASVIRGVASSLCSAFCTSWSLGIAELRVPRSTAPNLLGPSEASLWPRLLGFLGRMALHLEHRLAPPVPAFGEPPQEAPSETVLESLALTLTGSDTLEVLQALEKTIDGSVTEPKSKRARKASFTAPADHDMVLLIYERLLESLNVASFLSVMKRKGDQQAIPGSAYTTLSRVLHECYWRWSSIADAISPLSEGSRLQNCWIHCARLVQQMAACELSTPDVIQALDRIVQRTTASIPSDDSAIEKLLTTVFQHFEYEPQLQSFVLQLLGRGPEGSPRLEIHGRVVAKVDEILPRFRALNIVVHPEAGLRPEEMRALPTPMRPTSQPQDNTESLQGAVQSPRPLGERTSPMGHTGPSPESARTANSQATSLITASRHGSAAGSLCGAKRPTSQEPSSMDSLFKDCFREAMTGHIEDAD